MPKTVWWVLLAFMIGALALHLTAREQRRRTGRSAPSHETGGIIVTVAIILMVISQLIGVDTLFAQVLLGVSMVLTAISFAFIAKAFRRRTS
jgi:hypothetical protein